MEGSIYGVNLLFFGCRYKIDTPDIILISSALIEYGTDIVHEILLQLGIGFHRNLAEPELDMFEMENRSDIIMQVLEGLDIRQKVYYLLPFFFQAAFCLFAYIQLLPELFNQGYRLPGVHPVICLRTLRSIRQTGRKLICPDLYIPIRIAFRTGRDIFQIF